MAGGVRKIRGGQGGRKNITRFPSLKMKQVVWGESTLELDYHCLLEFDTGVTSFKEQPFRIEYVANGEPHFYTPDLFVTRSNGQRQVIEVKQDKEALKPENQLLYNLVRPICARYNYSFSLALESDIRREPRLDNVKKLLRYTRTSVRVQELLACTNFFAGTSETRTTITQLTGFCRSHGVDSRKVYALICRGALRVNLSDPLGPNSHVWLADRIPVRLED